MARKPKNSKIVTLSLDCDLMDLLEKYCERDRRTKSSAIELAIEKYLLMFERLYGIKSIILRVSNPYGERQNPEKAQGVIGVFLQKTIDDCTERQYNNYGWAII